MRASEYTSAVSMAALHRQADSRRSAARACLRPTPSRDVAMVSEEGGTVRSDTRNDLGPGTVGTQVRSAVALPPQLVHDAQTCMDATYFNVRVAITECCNVYIWRFIHCCLVSRDPQKLIHKIVHTCCGRIAAILPLQLWN